MRPLPSNYSPQRFQMNFVSRFALRTECLRGLAARKDSRTPGRICFWSWGLHAGLLFLSLFLVSTVQAATPQLVTVRHPSIPPPDGGSGDSVSPILSPDGRYVLFASTANNLVLVDSNAIPAVWPAPLN